MKRYTIASSRPLRGIVEDDNGGFVRYEDVPAIQANAIRSILDTDYSCETPNGDDAWSRSAIEKYANNIELSGQSNK